jgi:hypothetical protein
MDRCAMSLLNIKWFEVSHAVNHFTDEEIIQ